jgi:hypothetical protein
MAAGSYDFVVAQGQTFDDVFTWYGEDERAVDLSGWSAYMQVRTAADATDVALDLSSDDGSIVLGSDGTITFAVSSAGTAAVDAGSYKYDLFMVSPSGVADPLLSGKFKITDAVTELPVGS